MTNHTLQITIVFHQLDLGTIRCKNYCFVRRALHASLNLRGEYTGAIWLDEVTDWGSSHFEKMQHVISSSREAIDIHREVRVVAVRTNSYDVDAAPARGCPPPA